MTKGLFQHTQADLCTKSAIRSGTVTVSQDRKRQKAAVLCTIRNQ